MQEKPETTENEEVKGDYEVHDLEKPDFRFTPKGYHEWKQRGPYCICYSCELEHAIYIGVSKHLIGISEDGKPILKNVVINK